MNFAKKKKKSNANFHLWIEEEMWGLHLKKKHPLTEIPAV